MPPRMPLFFRRLVKATSFWQDNRLILQEFRHFPKTVALALLFPLLAAIFEGFGIGFLLAFLQNLVNPDAQPLQTGWNWFDIWVLGINTSKVEQLYRVSGLILLSTWIRAYFNFLTSTYMVFVQIQLVNQLYKRVFEQLQALSLSFFGKVRSGEIVNTLTAEIGQLQQSFGALSFVFTKGLTILVYIVVALSISWQLSVVSILLFSLAGVAIATLNKQVREASFPVSQARGRFTAIATEFINGIRTVHAFATQDYERRRFYQASDEVSQTATESTMRWAIVRPLAEAVASTILIGMIVVGMGVFVASGSLQIASLLTFIFILFRLVPSIQEINGSLATMSNLQGSISSLEELLRTDDKPYLQNGYRRFTGLQQGMEFVSVDFGYDADALVLKNVTLTFPKGQTVALVGSSGAGKSTLADLIPRFYDVTQGAILFDGVNIKEFDVQSIRHKMAIVSQDTFIFNTSVLNNIAYGLDNIQTEDVIRAAKLANALDFIQDLPEGFDTVLGDRGVRLSGGQRQRIAIARALLRNPEILILDEATSALDSVSERLIQQSLEELSVGRTVIAIAHRLSTIMRADKVVVLEQGQIVEQGTYQELLEQRGKLWNYHQMQNEVQSVDG